MLMIYMTFKENKYVIMRDVLSKETVSLIYYKDAILAKHTDRESCQYSVTICIKCDPINPWPISFNSNRDDISLALNQGDLCIYKGDELTHWREPCSYDNHIQFFLHFVDINGKYSDFKYDKRHFLGIKKH